MPLAVGWLNRKGGKMKKALVIISVVLVVALFVVSVIVSGNSQKDTKRFLDHIDEFIVEVEND